MVNGFLRTTFKTDSMCCKPSRPKPYHLFQFGTTIARHSTLEWAYLNCSVMGEKKVQKG